MHPGGTYYLVHAQELGYTIATTDSSERAGASLDASCRCAGLWPGFPEPPCPVVATPSTVAKLRPAHSAPTPEATPLLLHGRSVQDEVGSHSRARFGRAVGHAPAGARSETERNRG